MTIDEAILHNEEVAKENEQLAFDLATTFNRETINSKECKKCAAEHRQFAEWLRQLKQLREQTRWIPVSEKLPGKDDDYLVIYEKGYAEDYDLQHIGIATFSVDCESFGYWHESFDHNTFGSLGSDWEKIPVIAWMPLPKPYQLKILTGLEGSDKVNCDKIECCNCINHSYCDYEALSEG